MGRHYNLKTDDGSWGRTLSQMGMGASILFYEIAQLLAEKLHVPHGIGDQTYVDQYEVDPDAFFILFEKFLKQKWEGEDVTYLFGWGAAAAYIIEQIAGAPQIWKIWTGEILTPTNYVSISTDLEPLLSEERQRYIKEIRHAPKVLFEHFQLMPQGIKGFQRVIEGQKINP